MPNNLRAFSEARAAADDAEIERLEELQKEEEELVELESPETKPTDPEEATWRERYANHRRLLSKKEEAWAQEREQLRKKAEQAEMSSGRVPVTKEELEDYLETYPKVGALITQIVNERLNERMASSEEKLAKIDELEAEREFLKAKEKLAKFEPDFFGDSNGKLPDGSDAIIKRKEFHDWVQVKENDPDEHWIFETVYDSTNASQIASIVKTWKAETGFASSKPKRSAKKSSADAASSVRTTGKPTVNNFSAKDYDFTESQVGRMSIQDYERLEEDINRAVAQGRFLYDMSN